VQQSEDYVLRILQDVGLVTRPQIESARLRLNGADNVVDLLINDGIVSDMDVSRALAAQAHMDWIDISSIVIPPQIINQIRGEEARRFKVIPVTFGETGLVVAIGNPLDIDTIDSLGFLLQRELELVCTSPKKIREALIKYYGTADEAADVLQEKIGEDIDLGLEIGDGAAGTGVDEADAPIIRLVSMLLIEAHRTGASQAPSISHYQQAQDHDRFHEHRGEAFAAGRAHPGKDQEKADRSSRLDYSNQPWREHGHARAR